MPTLHTLSQKGVDMLPDNIVAMGGNEEEYKEFKKEYDAVQSMGGNWNEYLKFKQNFDKSQGKNQEIFKEDTGIISDFGKGALSSTENLSKQATKIPISPAMFMRTIFPQDKLDSLDKDTKDLFKSTDNSMLGKVSYSLGEFAPSLAMGEAATPEILFGDAGSSALSIKDLLDASKLKMSAPRNLLEGYTYGEATGKNPYKAALFQTAVTPLSEAFMSLPSSVIKTASSKMQDKLVDVIKQYKGLLGKYDGVDLEGISDKIYKGVKGNVDKLKKKMSGVYSDAIKQSDADGGKMPVGNLNQAATEEIQKIMDSYGFKQMGLNNIDMDSMTTQDKDLFKKLRVFTNKQPMSYKAADNLRQKLRKGKKSTDADTRDVMSSMYNAINKDFNDSEHGDLWKSARSQYAEYAQKSKDNPLTKAVSDSKSPDKVVKSIIDYSGNPDGLKDLITEDLKPDLEQKVIEQLGMTGSGDFSLNQMLNKYQKMSKSEPKKSRAIFTDDTKTKLDGMLKDRATNKSAYNLASSLDMSPTYMKSIGNDNSIRNISMALVAEALGHSMHISGLGAITAGLGPIVVKKAISKFKNVKPEDLVDIDDFLAQHESKKLKANQSSVLSGAFPKNYVIAQAGNLFNTEDSQ